MKYARVYFDDIKVGDELPPLVKGPIKQIQLTRYAGASGDFNPIHQDDEFARAARFAALVRLKDVVTCRGRVVAKSSAAGAHLVDLEVWAENQRAEKVVTGRATVALPARG